MSEAIGDLLIRNGFVVALLVTGLIILVSSWVSRTLTNGKLPATAIAIVSGLLLAYISGSITGGKKGIADIGIFSGFALMGGSMLRDFTIVSTAIGADFREIKRAGLPGIISLAIGLALSFAAGAALAIMLGYDDVKSITTIGAGACTFIVGPVTGAALGAGSDIIAISIAAGVVKSVLVTVATPVIAKFIGLDNPKAAMIFGGLAGTTSGVAAGLAATDPQLVPYGAITATFYTGLGCLLCPSVFYVVLQWLMQMH
jgi:malonate transporter MadM subunit